MRLGQAGVALEHSDKASSSPPYLSDTWTWVRAPSGNNNFVGMSPGTHRCWENLVFTAVPTDHSDAGAVGIGVDDGARKYCFIGDTIYNESLFTRPPSGLYAVFLPINGVGNSINHIDAPTLPPTRAQNIVPRCIPASFPLRGFHLLLCPQPDHSNRLPANIFH